MRLAEGTCTAPHVPAELIERHVLNHLSTFIGSVESWIVEQVDERESEHEQRLAAIKREQRKLADLDASRERHFAKYSELVEADDELATYALEAVGRIDRDREVQQNVIEEAQAVASEWNGPLDLDAALDFYRELVELVNGKVRQARGAQELNAALREVLAGIWVGLHTVRKNTGRLQAGFELRVPDQAHSGAVVSPRRWPTLPRGGDSSSPTTAPTT